MTKLVKCQGGSTVKKQQLHDLKNASIASKAQAK